MKRQEFSYLSSNGKTTIHGILWEPESAPKGILQIAHGITEHMGRYEELAAFFTERGYIVAGNDHLGHGLSLDKENPLPMYFGPKGSWDFVIEDIKSCSELLRERYPKLSLCLLGFSLGSFAVRCLLGAYPQLAEYSIWAGTGQMKSVELTFAKAIASLEERRFGDEKDTPLLHKLTMDTYNQRFHPCRTGADWLCANEDAIDAYLADPLCGDGFTVGSFRELLSGMKLCSTKQHLSSMNKELPILLISGDHDPVGSFGKGVEAVYKQLKQESFSNVEKQLFPNMRHDLFHEKDRDHVLLCMEQWLNKQENK